MSFSSKVKEELAGRFGSARHCQLAELSALTHMCGSFGTDQNGIRTMNVHTENFRVAKKCFTLMEKTFNIKNDILIRRNLTGKGCAYLLFYKGDELAAIQDAIVQAPCCRRAYIRGAFLAAGSMSDPSKSYHFEIVCSEQSQAEFLRDAINSFELDAKIVKRKKSYIVYLKEGAQISDALNIMEADVALMEFENIRIMRETRNSVNRQVNCETANISKTVSAAVRQIEDITYIRDTIGFDKLPEGLKDVALTRLAYPEAALGELGSLLQSPVGKSGVNHRLRKLSEIADQLREQ